LRCSSRRAAAATSTRSTRQVFYTPQGIIVSIDGFRAIAERTGCYAPGPTRYEYDENKALVAAYVTVRKLVAGTWFDVEESAFYEEYRGSSPMRVVNSSR